MERELQVEEENGVKWSGIVRAIAQRRRRTRLEPRRSGESDGTTELEKMMQTESRNWTKQRLLQERAGFILAKRKRGGTQHDERRPGKVVGKLSTHPITNG